MTYGGKRPLFSAAIGAETPAKLHAFAPAARKLIARLRVPVQPG